MNAFTRAQLIANQLSRYNASKTLSGKDKTLVIIDMQSAFMDEDEDCVIPPICTLICHAKANNWGILIVEFQDHGETDPRIHQLLTEYNHWQTVYKNKMDGSNEILQAIKHSPQWSTDIIVCGIYGPECVAETVEGLLASYDINEVEVIEDAIYPPYCPYDSIDDDRDDDYPLRARQIKVEDITNCKPTM